jgi:DNA-binding response OmpR family regulator
MKSPLRILVIEDDADRCSFFGTELGMHRVAFAETLDAAISWLNLEVFDLILLDNDLSFKGGEGVKIARMMSTTKNAQTRVIVHSMNIGASTVIGEILPKCKLVPFSELSKDIQQYLR